MESEAERQIQSIIGHLDKLIDISDRELWCNNTKSGVLVHHHAIQVRNIFLLYTYKDLIAFAYHNPRYFKTRTASAYAILGYKPSRESIRDLKIMFRSAKVIGVFDNNISGKVLDCKIALWLHHNDAAFWYQNNEITIRYHEREFSLSTEIFSLHTFRIQSGFRSSYKTLKAGKYCSFQMATTK